MLARHLVLTLSAAVGALAVAAPAAAQDTPYPHDADVAYSAEPMVQPLPGAPLPPPPAPPVELIEREVTTIAPPPPPPVSPMAHHGGPMMHHGGPMMHHPGPMMAHRGPAFDRAGWIANCRERIRGVGSDERASVIAGLLGAAVGGVVGNRAWDSERLAGTLIGAGVGGIAGLAIGAAIDAAGKRKRGDECALYLDAYMAGPAYGAPGYAWGYGYPAGGYGYNYGYGYTYAMMPVMVAVPQRAIVHETVTEETYDVPVRSRTITRVRTRHVQHAAPAPRADKRVKLIKGN